jgi:ribose-phosphate pyrophosphokinase
LLSSSAACKTASARRITAVIPCFPYARQPDAPYKKNGMPLSRVPANVFFGYTGASTPFSLPVTPAGTPLQTPSLDRIDRKNPFDKMFDSSIESASDIESTTTSPTLSPSAPNGVAAGVIPALSALRLDGENAKTRHIAPRGIRPQATSQPSHLNIPVINGLGGGTHSGTGSPSQTCVTTDQVNPQKPGYKHWVARSGTLIANLLVTAGKSGFIQLVLCVVFMNVCISGHC